MSHMAAEFLTAAGIRVEERLGKPSRPDARTVRRYYGDWVEWKTVAARAGVGGARLPQPLPELHLRYAGRCGARRAVARAPGRFAHDDAQTRAFGKDHPQPRSTVRSGRWREMLVRTIYGSHGWLHGISKPAIEKLSYALTFDRDRKPLRMIGTCP